LISIQEYKSYREYLKAYLSLQKESNSSATLTSFARRLGFSVSAFQMLLEGSRNLTVHKIHDIAVGLNFTSEEHHFFETLVHFEQSVSPSEKKFYRNKLGEQRRLAKIEVVRVSDKELLSDWYVPSLLIYLLDKDFDEAYVAKKLGISCQQIATTVNSLKEAKVIKLRKDQQVHIAFDKVSSQMSKQLFLQKLLKTIEHKILMEFKNPEVYLESHTLSMTEEDFRNFKGDYKLLLEKYMSSAPTDPQSKKIYQTFMAGFATL
jgi:uncharacterized protein (TIGR02147 family)